MGFQRGEPRPVMVPVPSAEVVNEDDIAALDGSGNFYKASEQVWNTDKYTTRVLFCANFAGVSAQVKSANLPVQWDSGFPGCIKINTGGVSVRPAAAGTYFAGDLVGPAKQSGNLLDDQIVEGVTNAAEAIGVVVGNPGVNPATLEVEVRSRKFAPVGSGASRSRVATVAATGSTQADAAQLSEGFTWVTAANATKGVLLPVAVPGMEVEVKNDDTANAILKIWPATGAAVNAVAANAAFSIAAKTSVRLKAYSATQWFSIPLLPS